MSPRRCTFTMPYCACNENVDISGIVSATPADRRPVDNTSCDAAKQKCKSHTGGQLEKRNALEAHNSGQETKPSIIHVHAVWAGSSVPAHKNSSVRTPALASRMEGSGGGRYARSDEYRYKLPPSASPRAAGATDASVAEADNIADGLAGTRVSDRAGHDMRLLQHITADIGCTKQ